MNRRREGLPLNAEETAMYAEYREKKTEYQREWRNENDGYYRDYKQKRNLVFCFLQRTIPVNRY